MVRWTLKDRPRFCNFVDDFRDLNEELKKLSLSNAGTVLARDRIILAALDDLGSEELELIEEAGADQVSDIASEIIDSRTERMSECSRSVRTYFTSSERIDQLEACTEVALPGSLLEVSNANGNMNIGDC